MDEHKPVTEYVTIELWEHTDRTFAYRMRSELGRPFDEKKVSQLLCEMAEAYLSSTYEDAPVIFSLMQQDDGSCHINWDHDLDFVSWSHFLWLKEATHSAVVRVTLGRRGSWLKIPFWFCEWVVMRLERALSKRRPAPPTGRSTPADVLSEQSDALENPSNAVGGNVVALRPRKTQEPS